MLNRHSSGLTLLEVVVILVIMALAVAMLLPEKRYHGESNRRTGCAQNLGQIHKAITMYEVDFSCYPTRALTGKNPQTDGDAQEALSLLYRAYIDDVRVFSCPYIKLSPKLLDNIAPFQPKGWPGAEGTYFKESQPGADNSFSTSYGYSPGHTSNNSRVIILADHKGTGPNGYSDNHGKDAGQNVLSAGGSVSFWPKCKSNDLGKDDFEKSIMDPDIFADNTKDALRAYPEWDSFCR